MLARLRAAIAVLTAGVLSAVAFAQGTLATIVSPTPAGYFGFAVDGCGDVNQDGFPDFLVGDHGGGLGGSGATGVAWVFSGKDFTVIRAHPGPLASSDFAWAVAGAGDVDLDGVPDQVVGGTGNLFLQQPSIVHVYSGATGVELLAKSALPSTALGWSVAGAGDANGDGHEDLVAGAPWTAGQSGAVHLYSGKDGALLHNVTVGSTTKLGENVAGADDVDGDGFDDFAAATLAGGGPGFGNAFVFSGRNGSLLRTHAAISSAIGDLSRAGDVDQDGVDELVVGEGTRIDVYSGATGGSLLTVFGGFPNSAYGAVADGAGDVNGDGCADLIVGAPNDNPIGKSTGTAYVYSGRDGTQLFAAHGDATGDMLAADASGLGDVDQDGTPDVLVSSWIEDRVYVLSGEYPTAENYGAGCPGFHDAIPTLESFITPQTESVSIRVVNILPHTFAVLVFGATTAAAPLPGGCVLNVGAPLPLKVTLPLDDGFIVLKGYPLPSGPFTVEMQAFVADPNVPQGFSATRGLELKVP